MCYTLVWRKCAVEMIKFYGNQVCCGSYACLNAIKDHTIDLSLFEISTSTPFGIKHDQNLKFDRLLTTLCDPNQGMNDALRLWGYQVSMFCIASAQEVIHSLKNCLQDKGTVVLGPLNMGRLKYHIIPTLLKRMDHYITIEYWSETEVLCTDSEGICQLRASYDQLQDWISVDDIPEADGKFTFRTIKKERNYNLNVILLASLQKAFDNLHYAEESGQGSNAIFNCIEFLKGQETFRWKLPILYDLEYLGQRKSLQQLFFNLLRQNQMISSVKAALLQHIILSQVKLIGTIYQELRWEDYFNDKALQAVGRLERDLVENLTDCYRLQ